MMQTYRQLRELSVGFWSARALHAAMRLDVFSKLQGRWCTAAEAARRLHVPARSGTMLLEACAALGLLIKRRDRYRNSPAAERWLIAGAPENLLDGLALAEEGYATWAHLPEAIQRNRPVHDRFHSPHFSSERFTLAMEAFSKQTAPLLAQALDLRRRYRLLDIGGGSGINALTLAQRHPWLQAVVLDRPSVCPVAARLLKGRPGSQRVQVMAGDYHRALPAGFDCALLAHILHANAPQESQRLLQRVAAALEPQGLLIVVDFLTEHAHTPPPFVALFALNMLLETAHGGVSTDRTLARWVAAAGFRQVRIRPLEGTWAHLLTAVKA